MSTPMRFALETKSAVPPYQQICDQVVEAVRAGELATGTRLPTVRQLAVDLGLAVNTVAKAYKQLEAEGHVATRGRAGTVVLSANESADGSGRGADEIQTAATDFAAAAHRAGLDLDATIGVLRRTW